MDVYISYVIHMCIYIYIYIYIYTPLSACANANTASKRSVIPTTGKKDLSNGVLVVPMIDGGDGDGYHDNRLTCLLRWCASHVLRIGA